MLWPFKYINGEQTEESKSLESKPAAVARPHKKPLSGYNVALLEIKGVSPGNEEEALL